MNRQQLLSELVAMDTKINDATSRAGHTLNDHEFEKIIHEVRELREQRAALQAELDTGGGDVDLQP